jgi:capsular polysaccharide transport system permease protein
MSMQGILERRFPEFATMTQVVGAVLMRDMQTRFGHSKFGFLAYLLIPFAHLGLIVGIYRILGRVAPLGNDPIVYYSLAVCGFVLFAYPYMYLIRAPVENKPLIYFPRVKLIDILIARAILEMLGAIIACCGVFAFLIVGGFDFQPHDIPLMLLGFASAIYLGISLGFLAGVLAALWAPMLFPANLLRAAFWGTSGTFFLPGMLPELPRQLAAYFPLLHSVELVRVGYYPDYVSPILDISYLIWFPTTAIGLAFLLHHLLRRYIKAA